jgi:hypothetical protein
MPADCQVDIDPNNRVGQTWKMTLSDWVCSELIGIVVEDDADGVATLLVLCSTGIFTSSPVGTLSRDKMSPGWKSWSWERLS